MAGAVRGNGAYTLTRTRAVTHDPKQADRKRRSSSSCESATSGHTPFAGPGRVAVALGWTMINRAKRISLSVDERPGGATALRWRAHRRPWVGHLDGETTWGS